MHSNIIETNRVNYVQLLTDLTEVVFILKTGIVSKWHSYNPFEIDYYSKQ